MGKVSRVSFVTLAVVILLLGGFLVDRCQGAAIIGIDFGTKFIKIAYVQPGKAFDIVLNTNSKRKTDNALAFDRGERLYGKDALGFSSRDPASTFLRSRDLLGTTRDGEEIKYLQDLGIKYELVDDQVTGGFKIKLGSVERPFRPEEAVGMILAYMRRISVDHTQTEVNECVITVPPYFTQIQREGLLNAAEIAGLKVLTLVDENVAAAVQHGIYNEFSNSSHKVLVYNMGSASTKVTLFNFWGKAGKGKNAKAATQVEVLAKAYDKTLGGDNLDMVMVEMIIKEFEKLHKGETSTPIRESQRVLERVRREANKVKTVLSANNEIPVSIESLHDGKDLRMHVTRQEFEAASKDLFDRVVAPIDKVLADAGVAVEDLYAVELIGGGIRVPRVKEMLTERLGKMELGNHLNGDEAKAFGAVFIGANMSKAFRVRPVGLVDITMDPVIVELGHVDPKPDSGDDDSEEQVWRKDAVLFNVSTPLGSRKVVKFNGTKDILCTLVRKIGDEKVPFAEYQVTGVDNAIEKFGEYGSPKLSLTYSLGVDDIVRLEKAEAIFVQEIPAEPEEEEQEEGKSESESAAGKEEEQEQDEEEKTEKDTEGQADEKKEEEEEEASESEDSKENEKKKKKKKPKGPSKKTHRFKLKIERTDSILTLKQLDAASIQEGKDLLKEYEEKEKAKLEQDAARNKLESYIFSSRDKIRSSEELVDLVLPEEEKDKIFEDLEALEEWIEDESDDAQVDDFKQKRVEMDKRINKIFRRIDEIDQRPATISASKKFISTLKDRVENNWSKERPWITLEEKDLVLKACETFETWLEQAVAEQEKISLQEDPVLTAANVVQNLEPVHHILESALRRPIPRPPKKKEEKKKKDKKKKKKEEEGKEEEEEKGEEAKDKEEEKEEEGEQKPNDEEEQQGGEEEKDEL